MMLPNGWKKVRLSELGTFSKGSGIKRDEANSGSIPAIRYGEIYTAHNDYIKKFQSFISENVAKEATLLKNGDLLFSCSGETKEDIGKCVAFVSNERAYAGGDIIILSPTVPCDSKYIGFLCNSSFVNKQRYSFAQGDSIVHISSESIGKIEIPFPPLNEQKKIAATLSVWDSAIEKMEKLIEAKIVQKKSLTCKLIENHNEVKFKLGNVTIDKSKWKQKSLKEMGSFSKGQGIKRDDALSGNIAAVRYGEIYTIHNDYIKEFQSFISKDVAKKSKLLKKGDLLFSCSGETKEDIGKCVAFVSDVVAYAGGDIIIFSPQIECDSKYLGFLLNSRSISKQKYGLGQGDSIVHISAESIGRLTVFLPSYPEQKAIADVLSAIDDELTLLKQQLGNYKKQKQGLMQKLLTGQWRVK
jgi:type I restriction enzyme S subunit